MKNNDYLKVVAEQQCKRAELVGYNKEKNISDIPNDYIELEYLESTGSQYIRTSLISNRTRTIDMDFMFTQLTSKISYVVSSGTGSNRFQFGSSLTNSFFGIGDLYIDNLQPLEANRKYNLKIHDYSLYIDDVKVAELNTAQFVSSTTNINLFDSEVRNSKVRIYKADFNSGLNVFIPVKRKSDNLVGMYNIVNNRFYERYGTGDFKAGDPRQTGINASSPFTFEGDNLVDLSEINVVRSSTSAGTSEVIRIPLIQLEPNSVYYLKTFGKFSEAEINFLSSSGLVVYSCGSSGFATGDYVNPYARCELVVSGLQVNTEYTFNQDTLKLMLVKSNTPPTKYVPYIKPLVVGENLWDEQWEVGTISYGYNEDDSTKIRSKNYIRVEPEKTYTFLVGNVIGDRNYGVEVFFYDINKNYISNTYIRNETSASNILNTISNCYYIRFRTFTLYGTTYNRDIMISEGTTAKPYSPYIHPINLYSNNGERNFASALISGYTEKSGDSLLSANTPLKFTGENLLSYNASSGIINNVEYNIQKNGYIALEGTANATGFLTIYLTSNIPLGTYYGKSIDTTGFGNLEIALYEGTSVYRGYFMGYGTNGRQVSIAGNATTLRIKVYNGETYNLVLKPMLIKGTTAPTTFEPYHETLYNPAEGFSLNGIEGVSEDTLNTANGEHIVKFGTITITNTGSTTFYGNIGKAGYWEVQKQVNNLGLTCVSRGQYVSGLGDICFDNNVQYNILNFFVRDTVDLSTPLVVTYELATPQTYQKKPKTLPQWVKHVFDSSGRELEATITPITLNEPVADTYQNANGKITRKTNKIELSIQNSVAQEYTGYSYLLKFAQPLAKPNTPILCDLENTNIVQDSNYLIVEYHNPSFTTQEQYYNYFLYEKHELIYERATYDTETIRSMLLDHRYTKCTDANGEEIEMKKA